MDRPRRDGEARVSNRLNDERLHEYASARLAAAVHRRAHPDCSPDCPTYARARRAEAQAFNEYLFFWDYDELADEQRGLGD